ncbi:MAG: hypothetical protein GY758_23410 [Fuerstiella sp.]|nr:hypothetical protein [Fuerstiella sp.]MCP4507344.1 hypothetical protein [Fuerstiella sp.]
MPRQFSGCCGGRQSDSPECAPDVAKPAAVAGTDKPELALQYLLRQKRPTLACFMDLAPINRSCDG